MQEDQQAQVPPPVGTQEEVQASVPKAEQAGVQVEVQPQDVAASVKARRRNRRSDVVETVTMVEVDGEETIGFGSVVLGEGGGEGGVVV